MIQYIVAAGLGALIGSAQKGKKKYKKGGALMKKNPAIKRQILRESDGIMDDADDLIRIADKKRLDRDDKMGIQTLADEMKFRAGNIYDTAQRKLAKGGKIPTKGNYRLYIYGDEDTILHAFSRYYPDNYLSVMVSVANGIFEEQGYGYATIFDTKLAGRGVDGEVGSVSVKDDGKFKPNPMYGQPLIRDFAKGGKIDFANRTSDDFRLGELVYDTSNKDYGTIIGIWDESPSDKYEVKLDSDGMQPTANLRKLGEKGDSGSKKQLFDAVSAYERLLRTFPDMDYPPMINNPFYAKGGTTSDKPKVTSISESLMKMDGEVVQWEDMDNARLMFGPAMNAQDVADALIEHDIFLWEYAPELYEGDMEDDEEAPTLKDSVDIDDIVDAIEDHRKIKGDNSYNYSAPFVFDFKYVETDDPYDEQLYFVREHRGGDVRGNYGQYMAFQLDSVEEHPLYGRISVYLETDKGDVTLDSDSIEGYDYEVINDETGTFEEYENVNADDIEEAFDFGKLKSDALNIFARGGRTKRMKKGGKTQGYNARLDESLAMRRGSKRTKKQGYKSRRHESEGMERSMGRRKYASVGTMDKGRRKMAHGGKTGREVITYNFYNIDGDVIRSGDSIVDYDKETITLPNGKTYKVKEDYEYTMKWQKTQVKAIGGIHGLVKTIKEFSSPDSPFNTSYAVKFAPKQMAKGGCTSCGKRGRKMAHGGQVPDYLIDELSSQTTLRKSALQQLVKNNHFSKDDVVSIVTGIGRGQIEAKDVAMAWLMGIGSEENEELVEFAKSGKAFDLARGGKTQGYNARLDESLSMRHGAGRKKEQGRKDRRDESEAMERSMGRRKYASVGTMDMGRRKMEDGGMVEYLLYGVAEGKPDYMEEILFVDDKPIRITEKLRDMASAKGFDRLRTSMVDLKIAPDFTKALNFKKGGKTKGRKKVSDFDKLAMKVAARYRAQGMSNEKAMEIGRGTAGKVARQQQAKKRKK